jgi:hypothetical protein
MSGSAIHFRKAAIAVSVCVALFAATTAQAATEKKNQLFKCVDAKGVVSIQSVRCPAGSTEAWRRDAAPEPPPTPEQAAQAEAKLRRDQQAVRELSALVDKKLHPPPAAAPSPVAPEPAEPPTEESLAVDACQAAQAFAASAREKTWLGLTDDQTRRLYGWVADQCRVPAKPSD